MIPADYNPRFGLTIAGEQETSIDTFRRPLGVDPSYLLASFGPVLIYCCDPRAVLLHHTAFEKAALAARQVFLAEPGVPAPPRQVRSGFPVTAALTTQPTDTFTVTMYPALHSRSGEAEVIVSVGALILNCRDRAAVDSLHQLWTDAARLIPVLWSNPLRAVDLERQIMRPERA